MTIEEYRCPECKRERHSEPKVIVTCPACITPMILLSKLNGGKN